MAILDSFFDTATDGWMPTGSASSSWVASLWGGRETKADVDIDPDKALTVSGYFSCIRNISEDLAKLPLKTYEQDGERKEPARQHPVYSLLHDAPNPEMTAMNFRETLFHHALGWGGGFAEIVRNGRTDPAELWPIHPSRVTPRHVDEQMLQRLELPPRFEEGDLVYVVKQDDVYSGHDVVIKSENMLHLHGLSSTGLQGYKLSLIAKEAIALGKVSEEYGARFFANDATPSVVLIHPEAIDEEAEKNLRESWARKYNKGQENRHKPGVLGEGIDVEQLSIPASDAQLIETRKFQVNELSRWFRVPPHKIQHMESATYSNIGEQNKEYVTDSLQPWAVRFEQECKRKLFGVKTAYFCEHLFDSLLRGTPSERGRFYRDMWNIGAMTQNEIRGKENMNPMPGGEEPFVPANMRPLSMAKEQGAGDRGGRGGDNSSNDDPNEDRELAQAHEPLIADAIERVVRKDAKAIGRKAEKHDDESEFRAWLEDFAEEQREYFVDMVGPAVRTLSHLVHGEDAMPESIVTEAAEKHKERLLEGAGDKYAAMPEALPAWVKAWERDRPQDAAREIVEQIME